MSTPAKKTRTTAKSSTERMRAYRERMRQKGFRQKTIWTLDLDNPEVLADYQRQAKELGAMALSDDDKAWLDFSMQNLAETWAGEDGK